MSSELILTVVGSVVTLGLGLLAGRYRIKLTQIKDLVIYVHDALDDDALDKDELKEIIRQIRAIV